MTPVLFDTTNYLVPSSGATHAVNYSGIFTSALLIDWRQFQIDNFPFRPQGVFIDNTNGITEVSINIQPINYNIVCPIGVSGQFQFPAPDNQTCTINASGQVTIIFVDFPVLPSSDSVQIGNTLNVNVTGPNPLPVALPIGSQSVQGTVLSNSTSNGYVSNLIVKSTSGSLFNFNAYSSNASTQWLQLHDATALPANGAVPKFSINIPATSSIQRDWNIFGRSFSNGIVICNSTTGPTLTIGAADTFFDCQYL